MEGGEKEAGVDLVDLTGKLLEAEGEKRQEKEEEEEQRKKKRRLKIHSSTTRSLRHSRFGLPLFSLNIRRRRGAARPPRRRVIYLSICQSVSQSLSLLSRTRISNKTCEAKSKSARVLQHKNQIQEERVMARAK